MTKWPVQKLTHRTTQKHLQHHDATDIKKNRSIIQIHSFNQGSKYTTSTLLHCMYN